MFRCKSRYRLLILEEQLRAEGKLPPIPTKAERRRLERARAKEAKAKARAEAKKVKQAPLKGKIVHPTPSPAEVARARKILDELDGSEVHDLPGQAKEHYNGQEMNDWGWLTEMSERRAARKRLLDRASSK